MALFMNKLGLSIDTAPKVSKKYLGEPDDPHYIPDSPLIDRQPLTAQQEAELKRTCTLVLANVPHTDDMTDDPLMYIAAQIQVKEEASAPVKKHKIVTVQKTSNQKVTAAPVAPFKKDNEQTATPSETSRRDTFDQTDYSTPLSSAAITPVETSKKIPESTKKPSTSKMTHGLRIVTVAQSGNKTNSTEKNRKSEEQRKEVAAETDAVKRTMRLLSDAPVFSESRPATRSQKVPRPARYSQPDLNKKLPPPPSEKAKSAMEKNKDSPSTAKSPQHISSWLLQAIKKKKTAFDSEDTSRTNSLSTATESPDARLLSSSTGSSSMTPVDESRKRFRLRLFQTRAHRQPDVLVS